MTSPPNGQRSTAPRAETPAAPPARSTPHALDPAAGGGLLIPTLIAGAGFAVLLVALTLGPYFLGGRSQSTQTKDAAPVKAAPAEPVAPPVPSPEPNAKVPVGPPIAGKPPGKGDILDKLGENGTKTAPTKVNPLDKKDDDILKDIK